MWKNYYNNKISDEVIDFIEKTMKCRVELTAGWKSSNKAKILRGVFQVDALSPLLYVIMMMPPNHILRECTVGYKLTKSQEKINHLILETRLYSRNLIKGISTLDVSLVKNSGPFLKWTREELKQMYQRTRKLMAMNKASQKLHWQTICVKKRGRKRNYPH